MGSIFRDERVPPSLSSGRAVREGYVDIIILFAFTAKQVDAISRTIYDQSFTDQFPLCVVRRGPPLRDGIGRHWSGPCRSRAAKQTASNWAFLSCDARTSSTKTSSSRISYVVCWTLSVVIYACTTRFFVSAPRLQVRLDVVGPPRITHQLCHAGNAGSRWCRVAR
jgi:hypothetical protein